MSLDPTQPTSSIPAYAQLTAGLTRQDVIDAVTKSGYPFQSQVADVLRTYFKEENEFATIQEEWAYIDSETGQIRSVDVFSETSLIGPLVDRRSDTRVTPRLSLLVECKQSEYPYVFFLRGEPPEPYLRFPEIAGIPNDDIRIFLTESDTGLSYYMSLHDSMGLYELPFFHIPTAYAISLSKGLRKGAKFELTGEEAYRSLTLPLIKAIDHLKQRCSPSEQQSQFDLRFIVGLAVFRAPMVGVYLNKGEHNLVSLPWVRVCRTEPDVNSPAAYPRTRSLVRYYDVVHEEFLPQYLEVILGDMKTAATRIRANHEVIATGMAEAIDSREETYLALRPLPADFALNPDAPPPYRIARSASGIKMESPSHQYEAQLESTVVGWLPSHQLPVRDD